MGCSPCLDTRSGLVSVTTSTKRPVGAEAYEGKLIYEADTNRIMMSTGLSWIVESQPWTAWTPQVDAGTTNIAKTVLYAKYCIAAGMVTAQAQLSITGSGTAGSVIVCSVPVPMTGAYSLGNTVGLGSATFSDAFSVQYNAVVVPFSGNLRFVRDEAPYGSWFGADPNVTVSVSDFLTFTAIYEMA